MAQNETLILRPFCEDDTDWIVDRHQNLYAQTDGFDDTFGPLVASVVNRYLTHDPTGQSAWVMMQDGMPKGSIFCTDGGDGMAQLRLFFLEPDLRGQGAGRLLLTTCLDFAKAAGYLGLFLWTHESHTAACALYAKIGFALTTSRPVKNFGKDLVEQRFQINF